MNSGRKPTLGHLICPRCGKPRPVYRSICNQCTYAASAKRALIKQDQARQDAKDAHCLDCGKPLHHGNAMRCRTCAARHNGQERARLAGNWWTTAPPSSGYAISAPGETI